MHLSSMKIITRGFCHSWESFIQLQRVHVSHDSEELYLELCLFLSGPHKDLQFGMEAGHCCQHVTSKRSHPIACMNHMAHDSCPNLHSNNFSGIPHFPLSEFWDACHEKKQTTQKHFMHCFACTELSSKKWNIFLLLFPFFNSFFSGNVLLQ